MWIVLGSLCIREQYTDVRFTVEKSKHVTGKKKKKEERKTFADPNGYLVISNYLLLSVIHCNVFSVVI